MIQAAIVKTAAKSFSGENMDASPITPEKNFNKNFMLQGSLTQRTRERKSTAKDLMVRNTQKLNTLKPELAQDLPA